MPNIIATTYMIDNILCVVGVCHSRFGPIPFAERIEVEGNTIPDGQLDLENLDENVSTALDEVQGNIMKYIKKERLELAAESLVKRARLGDQVAMAIIARLREQSRKNKVAKASRKAVKDYIENNPMPKKKDDFGVDPPGVNQLQSVFEVFTKSPKINEYVQGIVSLGPSLAKASNVKAAISLANGNKLISPRTRQIRQSLTPSERKQFDIGYKEKDGRKTLDNPAKQLGYVVGLAKRLQIARSPNGSLRHLSEMVAWELGEQV